MALVGFDQDLVAVVYDFFEAADGIYGFKYIVFRVLGCFDFAYEWFAVFHERVT
jgi:hypothetical protein